MLLHARIMSEKSTIPAKRTPESAGYDLYSVVHIIIAPQDKVLVPTDVSLMGPPSTYGRIADRSSLAWNHSLQVRGGVIDQDYRGNIQVILYNNGSSPYAVFKGDRVAPIVIEYYFPTRLTVVQNLPTSTRGTAGFGSTGLHDVSLVDYPDSLLEAPSIRVPDTPRPTPAPPLPLIELLPYVSHTVLYIQRLILPRSVAGSGEPGYNQNTNHPVSSETPGLTVRSPGDLQKLQLLLSHLPVMGLVLPVVMTCFGSSKGWRAPVAGDYPAVTKQNSATLCRRLQPSLGDDRYFGVEASDHGAESILVKAIELVQEGGTGCQEVPSMAEVQHTGEVTEPPEDHCLRDGWGYERWQCLESPATLPVAKCADLQQLHLWAVMDDVSAGECTPL